MEREIRQFTKINQIYGQIPPYPKVTYQIGMHTPLDSGRNCGKRPKRILKKLHTLRHNDRPDVSTGKEANCE